MIRLLAIDLDGTLLRSDRRISETNRSAIRRAQSAGITVLLASGRIRPSMQPFANELGLNGPMVCGNGTHAFIDGDRELFTKCMEPAAYRALIDYAGAEDIHLNLYTPDGLFFLSETPWGALYRQRVESVVPKILPQPFDGKLIKAMIVDSPDRIGHHRDQLSERLDGLQTRATESESEYLEFMALEATKGTALKHIAEELGIAQEETAAIGDYLNDLEMLEWAGLSASLENGHTDAKRVAKVTVSTNDEDGVAEFIDAHVLKQRQ